MGKKQWYLALGVLCAICSVVIIFIVFTLRGHSDSDIHIYYFNPSALRLEGEARQLPEGDALFDAAIGFMHTGPQSGALASTWPLEHAPYPEDLVQDIVIDSATLLAFISDAYNDVPPLDQALFKTAFVHTMRSITQSAFPYVTDIKLLIPGGDDAGNGEDDPFYPWQVLYNSNFGVYNDPFLSPAMQSVHTFANLHFVDETGTGLIVVSHTSDDIDTRVLQRAEYALELLIRGLEPEGALFPIPRETHILDMTHEALASTLFLDLSADFVNRFTGTKEMAELMIYSIVNTLTAFRVIDNVVFMIDTRLIETFHGVEDFNLPFSGDSSFLLEYMLAQEVVDVPEGILE